jgi:hypothetical protein
MSQCLTDFIWRQEHLVVAGGGVTQGVAGHFNFVPWPQLATGAPEGARKIDFGLYADVEIAHLARRQLIDEFLDQRMLRVRVIANFPPRLTLRDAFNFCAGDPKCDVCVVELDGYASLQFFRSAARDSRYQERKSVHASFQSVVHLLAEI